MRTSPYYKYLALAGGLLLSASASYADDSTLLSLLVKKSIVTQAEADALLKEAAAHPASSPSAATMGAPAPATPSAADLKKAAGESKTTIGGKMYIDVSSVTAKNAAGTKLDPSGVGIDVKRFYFGVTHQFDSMWLANINTDSSYSGATGATSVFIKTAYVQAKFSPEAIVQVGSANQPWIPFVEDNYGFRYVENTLTDRLHFGNSADWGVHFLGTSGMFSYNVAAVNGGGYKNPTRSNSVDLEGRVSMQPIAGLTLALGGYGGKLGKDGNTTPAVRDASRYDAMIAYATGQFKVGGEYFSEANWGNTAGGASDKGNGYSLWAQAKLSGPWSVFGRWDHDKTSKTLHPTMSDDYFNMGFQYTAFKGVDIALVYKKDRIHNPASAGQVADYDEFGVFAQAAF